MRKLRNEKSLFATAAIIIVLGVAGAGIYLQQHNAAASTSAVIEQKKVMPVVVDVVQAKPVQVWKEFSGRMVAVDYAEIRPQVGGTITEIRFEDGQTVAEGDVLYVIDPRPFKAAVHKAKAELSAAQNEAAHARKELKRVKGLIKTDAISQHLYDERANSSRVANAAVDVAKAKLTQAKIDLDHAYVKAPISGRISRAEITEGNLVEAGTNAPVLTSIVSSEGIYADFEVDEQAYLDHVRSAAKDQNAESTIPVKLTVGSGNLVYKGFIHSFDNRIDAASGTIRARAYFANEDNALLPGMFARVKIGSAVSQEHIVVSEKAIGTNQDRKFVYIVDDTNKVAYREVSVGASLNGARIIAAGLQDGDRVITEGIIRIRPNMIVEPQIEKAG